MMIVNSGDYLMPKENYDELFSDYIELVQREEYLQQENALLKDKIERSFKIVDDKLTNLNLEYGVNNEFREEYDELWEILKEN